MHRIAVKLDGTSVIAGCQQAESNATKFTAGGKGDRDSRNTIRWARGILRELRHGQTAAASRCKTSECKRCSHHLDEGAAIVIRCLTRTRLEFIVHVGTELWRIGELLDGAPVNRAARWPACLRSFSCGVGGLCGTVVATVMHVFCSLCRGRPSPIALAVASRAILVGVNVVLLDQLKSFVLGPCVCWLPNGKDFFGRTHVIDGVTVAVQAPSHGERLRAMHYFHLVNAAVTLHATHSTRDMRGVIEIGVITKLVNLDPFDGHTRFVALTHLGEARTVLMNLRVAIHACLRRWHCSVRCRLDGVVAVPAIETKLANVQRVAVRDWLFRLILAVECLWTKSISNQQRDVERSDRAHNQYEWKQRVRPAGKQESAHLFRSVAGVLAGVARGNAK